MYKTKYNSGFKRDSTQTGQKTQRTHRDHADNAMEPPSEAHGLSINRGHLPSLQKTAKGEIEEKNKP